MLNNPTPIINKPTTTTKINKIREVKMEIDTILHTQILFHYLKKYYPHFRGFDLDEIDMEFDAGGSGVVRFHAFKETNK